MKRSFLFLAEGFEEIEALTVVDVMRRAGIEVVTVSVMGRREVLSAQDVPPVSVSEPDSERDGSAIYIGGVKPKITKVE